MRVMQPEDFEKMARAVVDDYLKTSTPMEKTIVKVALDEGLNPDQIKNLVNMSNVMAHMTLFDKKAEDKIVEFEPADPASVLKQIYKTGEVEETVPDAAQPAPDRVADLFGDISELVDKVKAMSGQPEETPPAAPEEIAEEPEGAVAPRKRQMLIIKIRKVAEDLTDKKLQCAYEYKEELDKLATEFAKLYGPNHDEFEKDAMAARGETAMPVLADIRRCLRLSELKTSNFEKTARVVDTDTPQMKSLDRLIKLAKQFEDTSSACRYMEKEFGQCLR